MKLVEALNLIRKSEHPGQPSFDVFLACGAEPLHLATFVAAHLRLRLDHRKVNLRAGLYGDLVGNVARLGESGVAAGVVVLEWPDLDSGLGLRRLGGWGAEAIGNAVVSAQAQLERLLPLLERAAAAVPIVLVLPTLPLPPISPHAAERASLAILRLREQLAVFAARAAQIPRLKVLDSARLDVLSPAGERLDTKSEIGAGFPYRLPHASALGSMIALLVQPLPPRKGLVTDLDNTFWRGILGDDGLEGVSWDLESKSQVHGLYQQVLAALAEGGVLLAIASKNDAALVEQALARSDVRVPKDRFFPIEAHWQPKSESIGRILKTWNVAPDSVVFVDDSPLELAEVKAVHPQIECLPFPAGTDDATEFLARLRTMFGKDSSTAEDALRLDSLRSQAEVQVATASSADAQQAFLAELRAELTFELNPKTDDARPLELINKTNQFNLNGRRLSEGDYLALRGKAGAFVLQVSYTDKFGPLGKIAVLAGSKAGPRLDVSVWVMSCRAFSRRIEHRCVEFLFERFAVRDVHFDIAPTARNGPTLEFFESVFGERPEGPRALSRSDFTPPTMFHETREVSNG